MAGRNRDYGNEDYRRGQGPREWEEGRRGSGEWRAGRGGYEEERGYGGMGREEYGRMGREESGGPYGREEYRGMGREEYGRPYGREEYGMGREEPGRYGYGEEERGFGRTREDFGRGRLYEGREDYGRTGMSRGGRGGGYGTEGVGTSPMGGGRYGTEGIGTSPHRYGTEGIGTSPYTDARYGEERYGRGMSYGGMSHGMGRVGEDFGRGRSRYMGGGFGGMEPEMGRHYRPFAYGQDYRTDEGERRMGRGPRSYQRSDDRIREDVCERLMQGWMNAEHVDVQVKGGEVTLTGNVESRGEKRAIEDVAEGVLGVKEVHNQLRVRRAEERPGTEGGVQTTTGTQARGETQGPLTTSMHS